MTIERIDTTNISYQDLIDRPELLEQLERQARKERAAVVEEMVMSPLSRLLGRHKDDIGSLPAAVSA